MGVCLADAALVTVYAGEYSRPFIGSFRGTDVGYIELYRAAKDSIATRFAADAHGIGLHAAIAGLKFVNRGFAPLLLPRVVASLFELEPVVGESCSTRITATAAPVGSANMRGVRLPRRARHVESANGALRVATFARRRRGLRLAFRP